MPNGFHLDILLREEFTEKYLKAKAENLLRIGDSEKSVSVRVGVRGKMGGLARVFNFVSFMDRVASLSGGMSLEIETDDQLDCGMLHIDGHKVEFADLIGIPDTSDEFFLTK